MSTRPRGRAAPARPAHTTPHRATVPVGDLTLADGRRLAFWRTVDMTEPGAAPCVGSWWVGGDGMKVCASMDMTPHGRLLHVSLSYPDRYPTWDDIKAVRYALYPRDVDVAMMLPADGYYVNIHEYCMQMWQTPEKWGIT